MTRSILVAAALAALAFVPVAAHAGPPLPGGRCDGVVDAFCRTFDCGPDDLDCGLVPPCLVWTVATECVV